MTSDAPPLRLILAGSLRYWELRRLAFNALLIAVTVIRLWPIRDRLLSGWSPAWASLLILAAMANLLYCAAYLVDVPVQLSSLGAGWRRQRWLLWILGAAIAAALAWAAAPLAVLAPFA